MSIWPHRLAVKMLAFHACNENPPRVTPQPEDIYGIVKEVGCNFIPNSSDPEFPSWGSDLSRTLIKHTLMTIPYGAQNEEMLCIDVKLCTVGR